MQYCESHAALAKETDQEIGARVVKEKAAKAAAPFFFSLHQKMPYDLCATGTGVMDCVKIVGG